MSASIEISSSATQNVIASDALIQQERQGSTTGTRETAIRVRGLCKSYGAEEAVRGIDMNIARGEIFGLLGANGAGKTTTIKMLCGLIAPTSGEMQLAGERGSLRSSFVRQRVGYMSQKFSLYDDITINENLDFFAGVYQVPREEREEKKRWVLSFAGLEGRGEMITGDLPGGWKQRVAFGASIMHEPSVLFLDEPISGVDPLARRAFWKMINNLADRGVMLKGAGIDVLYPNLLALLIFAVLLVGVSAWRFRKQLG